MRRTTRDVLGAFLLGICVVGFSLEFGGGAPRPAPVGIPDPGMFVGWALPMVTLLSNFAAVAVVGCLLLAAFLLPSNQAEVEGLSVQSVRWASRWAWVWAGSSIALYALTTSDVFAAPLHELTPRLLGSLFRDASLGQAIVWQTVGAMVVAIATRWTLSTRALAWILGIALATLAPITLTGHAASAGSHTLATVSLLIHVVGVTLWVGGLAALAWVAARRSKRLTDAIERYSALALWTFVLVGVSGAINAGVRLGAWAPLFSSTYGQLVLIKTAALVALGAFGWFQRRRIVRNGHGFVRLAANELIVMAGAIGLGVALSRTPTPVGDDVLVTPAEELLGGPMPPAPTFGRLLFSWSGDGLGLAIVFIGTALYLRGVWTLRKRGDHWPIGRVASWLAGMTVVGWATFGGLGEYSHVMFSAHMGAHMVLSMVAPILLVLGAPTTLALRTLPGPRQPGEVSPRAMLNGFLNSRFSKLVTHPIVASVLFTGSLYGLYFSPLFNALMQNHWGHALMAAHFLAVGSLYYYVLIGVDPSPRPLSPIIRFGLLLLTIPFHAFFAIAVMSSDTVMAGDYYRAIERPFATDLLADQYLGGGIAWAMGEVPLVLVMIALFVQWLRSDAREAKRNDRKADRDGDAELEAYNAQLRKIAERDTSR